MLRAVARKGADGRNGGRTSVLKTRHLAMRDNRIVKAATREVLWSRKPLTPKYGYGFQVDSGFAGPGWIGHDGGFPGVEAFVTCHSSTRRRGQVFGGGVKSSVDRFPGAGPWARQADDISALLPSVHAD